ncbi:MAG: hypothetical protein E6Q90_00790 [Actinobacteria bacterium]|nr:MAG: hypothetical protein E6Q90_00790 [Actinomycetota bacterium]
MGARRVNKSAMRRAAAAAVATVEREPEPLREDLAAYLCTFAPQKVDPAHLDAVRPAVVAVMRRATHLGGRATFVKHTVDVTALADWAHTTGRGLGWRELMAHAVIGDFARARTRDVAAATHAHRVKRLLSLASTINPSPEAPPRLVATPYAAVQPPYTDAEMAAIARIVRTQPSPIVARKLAALVGLCRGAGASASELRTLKVRDVADLGDEGILVTLGTGDTRRTVPVRRGYEAMVRRGIAGLAERTPVVATSGAHNTVNTICAAAVALAEDAPEIEASRLRTTWIAELMTEPIGLHVLLAAAGLRSARTVTSIAEHLAGTPGAYRAAAPHLRGAP